MCELHALLYNNIVIAIFCMSVHENFVLTSHTNVNVLFTISKCFSAPANLFSNPLTSIEGDTLVFNQVEGGFGLDFCTYSLLF